MISPRVSTYAVIDRICVSSPGTSSCTTNRPRYPAVRNASQSHVELLGRRDLEDLLLALELDVLVVRAAGRLRDQRVLQVDRDGLPRLGGAELLHERPRHRDAEVVADLRERGLVRDLVEQVLGQERDHVVLLEQRAVLDDDPDQPVRVGHEQQPAVGHRLRDRHEPVHQLAGVVAVVDDLVPDDPRVRWAPAAGRRDQTVVAEANGAGGVWCARTDLDRIVDVLVENALAYAPAGSRVLIRGAGTSIEVLDEGHGIGPDEQELVFERFHRGRAGRAGPAGTGLGLSIARGLAQTWDATVTDRRPRRRPRRRTRAVHFPDHPEEDPR